MEKSMRRKNLASQFIRNEFIKNYCIEPNSSLCIFNNKTCNSGEMWDLIILLIQAWLEIVSEKTGERLIERTTQLPQLLKSNKGLMAQGRPDQRVLKRNITTSPVDPNDLSSAINTSRCYCGGEKDGSRQSSQTQTVPCYQAKTENDLFLFSHFHSEPFIIVHLWLIDKFSCYLTDMQYLHLSSTNSMCFPWKESAFPRTAKLLAVHYLLTLLYLAIAGK